MGEALPRLLADWHVLHVCGEAGMSDAGAARAALPGPMRHRYIPEPFLTDRMADALVAADLVVGRAGSSTCAELAAAGVASILVPYPYAGAHQRFNAAFMAERGAAIVVPDVEFNGERLLAEAEALRDDERRTEMGRAARRLARPEAAHTLALELLAMAEGRPLPLEAGVMTQAGGVQPADRLEVLDHLAAERRIDLEWDVPLASLTTLRVGGSVDRLTTAATTDGLVAALRLARDAGVPGGVLGKGSDIVVADRGIRGLVVRNRADAIEMDGSEVRAQSGAAMAALVKRCTSAGLGGIEFGISIPGSVGGAVWANAGAHGGEMKDVVITVDAWSGEDVRVLEAKDCGFAYRSSSFKDGPWTILAARLRLRRGHPAEIAAQVAAHQAHRRATQPLADQNAGSVFRNPVGDHAGRLIDEAGLKGHRIGSAEVSTLHANFIVVDRGGSAADVRRLGDHVRSVVADRFGVELQYEIEFVGDWDGDESWATPTSHLEGVR